MTCVAYVETDSGTWLGTDSVGVSGNQKVNRKDKRIIRRDVDRDVFLFAGAGSFRLHDLLLYSLEIPKIIRINLRAYMVAEFIPALRVCLRRNGALVQAKSTESSPGAIVTVVRGRVFYIQTDFQIAIPEEGYGATGSGRSFALGSLATTHHMSLIQPRARVEAALSAAKKHCVDVGGSFDIQFQPKRNR